MKAVHGLLYIILGIVASWISFVGKHKKCLDILKSVGVV